MVNFIIIVAKFRILIYHSRLWMHLAVSNFEPGNPPDWKPSCLVEFARQLDSLRSLFRGMWFNICLFRNMRSCNCIILIVSRVFCNINYVF